MMSTKWQWWGRRRPQDSRILVVVLGLILVGGVWMAVPHAQSFPSGSDGSDGALTIAPNLGTIVFDPADSARWGRPLDADGDAVFNFSTITIGAGTTVRLTADRIARSVYWLATGDVSIAGTIDLRGAAGIRGSDLGARRQLAVPGPGGFAGGAGGRIGVVAATAGDGPGGGEPGLLSCSGTGPQRCGVGGRFSSNRYLVSLVGGSGGGGSLWDDAYHNGGAGGGALLIASSTSLSFTTSASILAGGGAGGSFNFVNFGGGGSGGAIRLVAPTINAAGTLSVTGGSGNSATSTTGQSGTGGPGVIRLERFTQNGSFTIQPDGSVVNAGTPVDPATLMPLTQVRVTSIGGVAVSPGASGSFTVPDVTISSAAAVPVEIEATGIPNGTTVTLQVFPQSPDDVTLISLPPIQTTLTGTLQRSTATVNFVFPYGFSRGTLRATWQ